MSEGEPKNKNYDVGYGKPPKSTQFKRGQSGNPAGRPKGAANLAAIVQKKLAEKVVVIENGRQKRISKGELLVGVQFNRGAKGDARAFESLSKLSFRGEAAEAQSPQALPLTEDDESILERYVTLRSTGKEGSDGEPT